MTIAHILVALLAVGLLALAVIAIRLRRERDALAARPIPNSEPPAWPSRAELEEKVRESTAELARAHDELRRRREDLESADKAKDEFLGILSHELRNPIHAIQTNAFLIKTRTRDISITRPTDAIDRQVDRLTTLVEDLLDVVRVSQKQHLTFETVSLQNIVVAAIATTQERADVHRRELQVDLSPEPLFVKADRGRLEQAIGNLVHNAIKYSSQQGSIIVSVRREDGLALVSVKDQGIGISPEELKGLFNLFSRGAMARKHVLSGLGIGLHMARALVSAHGGTIEARSDGVGQGAEFIVRLPMTADIPAAAIPAEPELAEDGADRPLSILVIDDNHDAADSLHDVLEVYGHTVVAAYDGESAVQLVEERSPQVALVDIGMPHIDGYEVARRVNALPGPKPVLVAVTGWGSQADKEQAKEAGFAYHLTKPLEYDTLAALLATVARKAAKR